MATLDPAIVRNAPSEEVDAAMRGHILEEPERHGKWLLAWSDGPALLLHFGMTGGMTWGPSAEGRHVHDRLVVELDHGELRYRNMRKFGGVWLAHDRDEVAAATGALGPDALRVDRREFLDLLAGRRGRIKSALMDQTLIAGIGNLLADEILWQARIHPARTLARMSREQLLALHSTTRRVLQRWIERYGSLPKGWLIRARRKGECPRCGAPLLRIVVGGRTTYFCPRCQPA